MLNESRRLVCRPLRSKSRDGAKGEGGFSLVGTQRLAR